MNHFRMTVRIRTLLAWSILTAVLLHLDVYQATAIIRRGTILYQEYHAGGNALQLAPNTGYPNLGDFAGQTSSLIPDSAQYTCVWDSPNFNGNGYVFPPGHIGIIDLQGYEWNDRIMSVRLQTHADCTTQRTTP